MNIILGSASPRRAHLLQQVGLSFTVDPSGHDEVIESGSTPEEIAAGLADEKAAIVASRHPSSLIIGADTIVVHRGSLLGKPSDKNEALKFLTELSGSTHSVFTGVCVIQTDQECNNHNSFQFTERTDVTFSKLEPREIEAYVDRCSPFDKAGSYGIQDDMGSLFVERIDGDFYNVVGFPLHRFYYNLKTNMPEIHHSLFFESV